MMFLQCAEGSPMASISLKVEEARVQFEQTEPHGRFSGLMEPRLTDYPQIQACKACDIIPKKTDGCGCYQSCFNQALRKNEFIVFFLFFFFLFIFAQD